MNTSKQPKLDASPALDKPVGPGSVKVAIVLFATAVLAVLVSMHAETPQRQGVLPIDTAPLLGMNGPWYWKWPWQNLPFAPVAISLLVAAAPLVAAIVLWQRKIVGTFGALTLLMVASLLLQLSALAVQQEQYGLGRAANIVSHPGATGYMQSALQLHMTDDNWLSKFHQYSASDAVVFHAKTKPPGWIVFNAAMLKLFPHTISQSGSIRTLADLQSVLAMPALYSSIVLGVLATLSIPAVYLLIWQFSQSAIAAVRGAALMTLAPAMVVWLPQFDPVYPVFACLWLVLWAMAMQKGKVLYSVLLGLLVALSLFMAYNFMVLGALLVAYAVAQVVRRRVSIAGVLIHAGVAVGAMVGAYIILWLATGFNPILSFAQALNNQHALLAASDAQFPRPYPYTILFDLTDFVMGGAWIALLPVIYWVGARLWRRDWSDPTLFVLLGLGQLILVALTHILACETIRVWLFMLPLLILPAALELKHWKWSSTGVFLACVWLLTVVIVQNMKFVDI